MNIRAPRSLIATTIVVGGMLVASNASAEPISDWADVEVAVANAAHPSEGPFDVTNWQSDSKTMLAMFEAANAIDRRYRSYLKLPQAARDTNVTAAVASAAHDTLIGLFPKQSAMINDAYMSALANVPEGVSRTQAIAVGHMAATAALAAGGIDRSKRVQTYWPATNPGTWVPTTETVISPLMATYRTWFMTSNDQFRPGPPIALTSARWAKDLDEVRRIGAKTSAERLPLDTMRARFWASYDEAPAMRIIAEQRGRSLVQNARFYALVAMARDDEFIAVSDSKLHYSFWRPISAIRAAHEDNAGGRANSSWEPLLQTPLHPEYPCGHCVRAAMTASLFEAEGPPPEGGLRFTNPKLPGVSVAVPTPAEYSRQVSFSRICAGVHFRSTAEASEPMGHKLAAYAIATFAPPI